VTIRRLLGPLILVVLIVQNAQALLANGRFLKERFASAPMFRPT
jgi:hypothetical protein